MNNKIKISAAILCFLMLSMGAYCLDNTTELDKGKSIFKKEKTKKIKVKPTKEKRQYKVTPKVQQEYSIPTDVYMNVGAESDKSVRLEGSVVKENPVLNLADCIELALINNPKIKAAYAKSEISKYQKWETLSGYAPRLDWSSSINRTKPDLTMLRNANMNVSAFTKYTLGQIGIKQLVWDFGYTQNQYTINKIDFEKSKTEIDKTVNEVVTNVKDSYYNLMYAFDRKQVAQDTLEDYTNIYHQALAFWEVGTTTKVDVLFAQTNLEQARADLISANNNIDIAYSQLNNAMGLPFVDAYTINTKINYEPVSITMKECVEIANASRPDLKGAMLNVDMADQAVKLSWKTVFPKLEFQANWATGGIEDWTDKNWYNLGGFLTFPTVNPVLLRNQVKEARAQYEAMQYETKSQLNDIYYDIQNVYTRLKDAKARIPVSQTALDRAKENYELTSGRYKVGYGNVIELKDAQVALSSAKLAYYQTIYEYNSARANLERAIGQTIKPDEITTIETEIEAPQEL
ncbi:MAG: TolC family protein [Candidatus Gastranaerophilales bacterium]|nr:TolC family protein [Candidatus Gastranaerophilales bacterium]